MNIKDLIKMINLVAETEHISSYDKSKIFGEIYVLMQYDNNGWLSNEHFREIKKFIYDLADKNDFILLK